MDHRQKKKRIRVSFVWVSWDCNELNKNNVGAHNMQSHELSTVEL